MLFSDTCKKVTLYKESDLNEIVEYVKHFTFEEDDSKRDHEFFSLYLFLIAAFKIQKLTFPVEILKSESPDFRLSKINEEPYWGLEHTRATVEKYKMDESEFAEYPEGSHMELPYYTSKDSPSKKSRIALKKPSERLTSSGYGDNGIEKQWTEILLDSLKRKRQQLNKETFEKYRRNELLIENDGPAPVFCRFDNAIKILKETYIQDKINDLLTYGKVHVYSGCWFVYDVFGETIKVDISKSQLT